MSTMSRSAVTRAPVPHLPSRPICRSPSRLAPRRLACDGAAPGSTGGKVDAAALGFIGAYVLLVGIASFLEGPLSRSSTVPPRCGLRPARSSSRWPRSRQAKGAPPLAPTPRASASAASPGPPRSAIASPCANPRLVRRLIANGYVAVGRAAGVVALGDPFDRRRRPAWLDAGGRVALSWQRIPSGMRKGRMT